MDESSSFLTFCINDTEFALPADKIQTILDASCNKEIETDLSTLKGISVRDHGVVPIVDLGGVLGFTDICISELSSVILTDFMLAGRIFKIGLLVDKVTSVLSIRKKLVNHLETAVNSYMPKEVKAVVNDNDQKIYLLNMENLFSEDDLLDFFIEIKKSLGMQLG
jgi:chemotaxis signal transduction protein